MALYKNIQTQYGIDASYIRVAQTNINWTNMMAHIEVLLYVNQDVRRAENNPIGSMAFDISILPYMALNIGPVMNVAAVVYGILKTLPEFAEAEDVIDAGQIAIPLDEIPTVEVPGWVTPEEPVSEVPEWTIPEEPIIEPPVEDPPV